MRTIAANANQPKPRRRLREIVTQRHSPYFFDTDHVKIVLPILQESAIAAAGVLDEDGRLTGLLTERSILRRIFARSADKLIHAANVGKYIDDMTVAEAMIEAPETLDDDMDIETAAALMLRRGFSYMPVVSRFDRRQLLGIVSERELAHELQLQLQEARKNEKAHQSLLSYMLCEPYGCGKPAEA